MEHGRLKPSLGSSVGKRLRRHRLSLVGRPSRRSVEAGSYTLNLSPKAMKLVTRLAEETNSSPDEVLRQSVILYKMALDARKKSRRQAATPTA